MTQFLSMVKCILLFTRFSHVFPVKKTEMKNHFRMKKKKRNKKDV